MNWLIIIAVRTFRVYLLFTTTHPITCRKRCPCGNPVIGTDSGGTAEYLVDGESGIAIPPRDVDAIACALNSLILDEAKRLKMGENARKRVVEHFDRKKIAEQTSKLYELAIERHSKRQDSIVYRKKPEQMLKDAYFMMKAFDTMIYDTLYVNSYRFRIRHWTRICTKRPRLFVAKAFLKITRVVENLTRLKLLSKTKLFQEMETESISKSFDQPIEHLFEHRSLDDLAIEFEKNNSQDVVSAEKSL